MIYRSALPDAKALTPQEGIDLLARLGGEDDHDLRQQIYLGHLPLLKKLVGEQCEKWPSVDPDELEAVGAAAMWNAVLRLEPRPGMYPYKFLRIHTWGALHKFCKDGVEEEDDDENKNKKKRRPKFEPLPDDDDLHPAARGNHELAADLQDAIQQVELVVPGFSVLLNRRAFDKTSWPALAGELGEPVGTLRSRFQRGQALMREIFSE